MFHLSCFSLIEKRKSINWTASTASTPNPENLHLSILHSGSFTYRARNTPARLTGFILTWWAKFQEFSRTVLLIIIQFWRSIFVLALSAWYFYNMSWASSDWIGSYISSHIWQTWLSKWKGQIQDFQCLKIIQDLQGRYEPG